VPRFAPEIASREAIRPAFSPQGDRKPSDCSRGRVLVFYAPSADGGAGTEAAVDLRNCRPIRENDGALGLGHHDVFISYAREDRAKVEKLARALGQRGLHVWWDPEIKTGAGFREEIAQALSNTKSVIVVWSRHSVASRFVADEADEGAAREILFPALIDNVDIPLGFRQIQTADLTHWRGNLNDPAFREFVDAVSSGAAVGQGARDRRPAPAPEPQPTEDKPKPAPRPKPKKQPKPKAQKQKMTNRRYTTTGSKRRLALFGQAVLMAGLIASAFAGIAYTSDMVFPEYRLLFVGAMGALAFLSRYGTLEADRSAGAASLALLPRSYVALILVSLIAIAPMILQGRIYAAALEGVQVKGVEGADINATTLNGAGDRLLTSSDDGHVKLWDATTGVELGDFSDHFDACEIFDDDGKPLCWVWDAAFSPDGQYAVSASRDKSANIWRTRDGSLARRLQGHGASVYDAAWSPDGDAIATASSDHTIMLWNPDTGDRIGALRGHANDVNALDFSPDGATLASASEDGNVRLWNWREGAAIAMLAIGGPGNDVEFSNDGSMLAAAAGNGNIRIWRAATRERIASFKHGAERAFGVAFVNGDKQLATSGIDPIVRIWSIADQALAKELSGHKDAVRGLDSSADGMRLVSGSRDNTARIWDPVTGKELVTVGHIDSALDLPMAIDAPPVFVSSQAPAPVDFGANPGVAGSLIGKGLAAAFALMFGAMIVKGVFWVARLRVVSRFTVVSVLLAVAAYVGLLIASALPAEALALWLTLSFVPATVLAFLRWMWRAAIMSQFNRRTRRPV